MYDWSRLRYVHWGLTPKFQLLLKGCTIEAAEQQRSRARELVSVVVERMYDWSRVSFQEQILLMRFQLLLKGCTIEARWTETAGSKEYVSVVVERMYDWSLGQGYHLNSIFSFQLLLKGCTIEASPECSKELGADSFSCCWKDVRLKLRNQLIENKWFLTVGFWSVFRKWSICTKSAIIFENLGWFGWLLDCFW